MKYISRYLTFLLTPLLILTLSGQGLASGLVWCIGEDGHAALEFAVDGNCQGGHAEPIATEKPHFTGDDHCGPCIDLPGSLDFVSGRSDDRLSATAMSLAVPAPRTISPPAPVLVSLRPSVDPAPPPSQALRHLRTIVLLN